MQVHRRPRHQLAGLLRVEEAKLERLQMAVDPLPQVEFDRHRHPARDQPANHRQPEPEEAGADDRQRERQERGLVGRRLDRVHGPTDEPRDRHRHHHRQPGEAEGPEHRAAIRTQESEQPPEGGHALTIQSEVVV